jgi:hypothetical protein
MRTGHLSRLGGPGVEYSGAAPSVVTVVSVSAWPVAPESALGLV